MDNISAYLTLRVHGCDAIQWLSSKEDIVTVDAFGVLTTHNSGESSVKATCEKNELNSDSIVVKVTQPNRIKIVSPQVEAQVGHPLFLPVAIRDADNRLFDNCSSIPLVWELSNPSIFSFISSSIEETTAGRCTVASFLALKEGSSVVTAKLNDHAKAEVRIVSYNPLRVVEPANHFSLVTFGSSSVLSFTGGPLPWYENPSLYKVRITPKSDQKVQIIPFENNLSSIHSYNLICLEHDTQTVEISVSNEPTESLPHPALAVTNITFSCQPPHTVSLHPEEQVMQRDFSFCQGT